MVGTLDNAETAASLLSNLVTAVAVLIGGFWAYFKFFKGRTFSLRATIETSGTWCTVDERHLLRFRVILKNTGSSKFTYLSAGTRFVVSRLTVLQGEHRAGTVPWERIGAGHELFADRPNSGILHTWWLEPEESAVDEFLIDLQTPEECAVRYDIYINYKRGRSSEEISECGIILAGETL
jgi:hypothetical protein